MLEVVLEVVLDAVRWEASAGSTQVASDMVVPAKPGRSPPPVRSPSAPETRKDLSAFVGGPSRDRG